ncbi:MAG: glycosyltransferase family 4 protein [Anaerolineae bacterium]|nr:glycosyltransferase family 4 protein [Anaerolineae bacterium]HRA19204.1 glycosyltransferase family 4 protein [Anaerolineae bacterium]
MIPQSLSLPPSSQGTRGTTPVSTGASDAVRPIGSPAPGRPLRVLMVAPTSFFLDYGCHVRILEEARVLQGLGQRVRIVTYANGQDMAGLDIHRCLTIPWRRDFEVGSSRHKLGLDLFLSAAVLRAAWSFRPDIIHGHLHEGALIGGAVARVFNKPLVFDFQGSLTGEMVDHGFLRRDGRVYGPMRRLERLIDHLPSVIMHSSQNAAEHLRQDFGVPQRRLFSLPDFVNTAVFRPDVLTASEREAERATLGIPPGRQVIAYLGLLARHQGTDLLMEAARQVVAARPDSHFLVMGFPGMDQYAAQAAALGIAGHVTFTGRVPYALAPRRLALGDIAVAPKIAETEGSGKLMNYMAMGLPTVAFDLPVCREYLGESALRVPPGDAGGFAAAILGLLADPQGAATMGRRLRLRAVESYDWSRGGDILMAAYDSALRSRSLKAAA